MTDIVHRILIVDDAQIEYLALERMLQKIPRFRTELDWIAGYAEAQAAIEQGSHDLYFIDYRLGPDNGLDLIRHARRKGITKPIIVLTGHGSAAVDEVAAEVGANDYLVKGEFNVVLLERAIRYATRNAQNLAKLDQRLLQWKATAQELQLQTGLRAAAEAEVQQVLRKTMSDQEAERKRIARELHDNLGQSVVLVQLGLDAIARSVPIHNDIVEKTVALKRIARDIGTSLHRIAWEVRPVALDTLGLVDAITQLVSDWEPLCSLKFDLHLGSGDRRLPPDTESTLYRIVQEGITNVVRHANASRVGIILDIRGDDIICIIEDDGIGMSEVTAQEGAPRRLGLLGMRERLALIDGSIEIESSQTKGTALFVKVPLGASSD
uniref:Response regulator receiver sensor signal transduction histidine kinase n=1 Tax=Rhodopseudomonas palustris (strain BisA53) TaxID=316055 RepID=Q07TZ2_RHOP5